ncbi:MAG: TIR domain-containing protein [Lachnospiraceae bacterium]|nr:TIR domain-containing protein [Lachnospiraceae bacterium]
MNKVYDVFISYRRSDGEEYATKLLSFLRTYGLRVFFDKQEMECGRAFPTQLSEALISAPHYILIGSPDAFTNRTALSAYEMDYVREEMRLACEKDTDERTIHVLRLPSVDYETEKKKADAGIRRIFESTWLDYSEDSFHKIFNEITEINKQNVWYGAHRWFTGSRSRGGRFANLHIEETILPPVMNKPDSTENLPISVHEKQNILDEISGEEQSLIKSLEKTDSDIYLIGEGGIGKTTALMHIMRNAYEGKEYREDAQIPVFIELSFAPDSNYGAIYDEGKSSFIRRSVFRQVRTDENIRNANESSFGQIEEVFSTPLERAVRPVDSIFRERHGSPEYLLLLDGMNEVSMTVIRDEERHIFGCSVYQMILDEMEFLSEKCPNVQIVVTSRSDNSALYGRFRRLYLSGLSPETISAYLGKHGMPAQNIMSALSDNGLRETLPVPLFLTLYAKIVNKEGVTSQGEILKSFFHERSKNVDDYSAPSRLDKAEKNMKETASEKLGNRMTAEMYRFILDFILPEIAWNMERESIFYCDPIDAEDWIKSFFKNSPILGKYGRVTFESADTGGYADLSEVSEEFIKGNTNDDYEKQTRKILERCVYTLGILQKTKSEYGFIHQHLRDYFAAVRNINILRVSAYMKKKGKDDAAFDCMQHYFADKPVSLQVRRFMGECLGEQKNRPFYAEERWNYGEPEEENDRNLLRRSLDIYRRRFSPELEKEFAVYSLIETLKSVRQDLSGFDFSHLDLWNIRLNGCILSRPGLFSLFSGTKLNYRSFGPSGHTEDINSVRISHDGTRIVTTSSDNTAKIWKTGTLEESGTLRGHHNDVNFACFSPDDKSVLTASSDNTVKIWDAETLQEVTSLNGHIKRVNSVNFSPDGKRIITASNDRTAIVWDTDNSTELKRLKEHKGPVNYACYSPKGNMIVTASSDCSAVIWDSLTFEVHGVLEGHTNAIVSAVFSPDGKRIVTASEDRTAKVWDATTYTEIGSLKGHTHMLRSAFFSPDGKRIITVSKDLTVKFWDANSFALTYTLGKLVTMIHSAVLTPDGTRIIISVGRSLQMWDVKSFRLVRTASGHMNKINYAGFSPNGEYIVTLNDKTAMIWAGVRDRNIRLLGLLHGHRRKICSVSFSHDGKRIVTSSRDKTAKIWDAESFRLIGTLEGYEKTVISADFSLDGEYIVAASEDNTVSIWDPNTCKKKSELYLPGVHLNTAVICPDGKTIATVSEDENDLPLKQTVFVWDLKKRIMICMLNHRCKVDSVAWSKDQKRIVTVSNRIIIDRKEFSNDITIWDAFSFERIQTRSFPNQGYRLSDIAMSPDGKHIAAIRKRSKNSVAVYDASNLFLNVPGVFYDSSTSSVEFSPDSEKIIFATNDGRVTVMDINTRDYLDTIENISGVFLSGCDLRELHPDSFISEEEVKRLYQAGAII